ncbi:MAG TPA: CRISPR-associated endonuclease Cas1 [Aggregatilinea sp.]|uniref:CRISPR-associated endonuclease Cas1 n=1 Tax=Aggregatilinea sp. TaxID=2806333 RepID=UPI002CB09957|nr:CRISPR-associated endonuclease Cas1 [Aggregatilinea sp.]HML22995.1 CRISPR-associated endonuclease Cas1 [Aggregatilinea sp.]
MAIVEDLIVSEYGAFVGLHGKRLRVHVNNKRIAEAPLLHLRSVQIHTRSASLSAAALAACCEAGIPVHFVDSFGGNYASVLSPNLTTVITTRRHQLDAMNNQIGVDVALQIGVGKIKSQAANLRYLARRQPEDVAPALQQSSFDLLAYADRLAAIRAETIGDVRAELMGIEGQCARLYWSAVAALIPDEYQWSGRTGRHATDPVNCLLNYGYGILYGEVQNALVIAGLEPYAGLIHTDRPGKPSLTLDLIEEFRAPVVDRTVIGLVNRHYEVRFEDDGRMEREFRKSFAKHILSRLNAQGVYQKKRYQLRSIIQLQARALATALRGEQPYLSYTGG